MSPKRQWTIEGTRMFGLERGRFSEGQGVREIKKSACKYCRHWYVEGGLVHFVLFQRTEIGQIDKTHTKKI